MKLLTDVIDRAATKRRGLRRRRDSDGTEFILVLWWRRLSDFP